MFKKWFKRSKTEAQCAIQNVSVSVRTITKNDVKMHYVNTGGCEFMCKNCGDKYDAITTVRHYCDKCGCWICPKCAIKSNLCAECSAECSTER